MTFRLKEGQERVAEVVMMTTKKIGLGIVQMKANRRATPPKRTSRTRVARHPTKVLPILDELVGKPPFPLVGPAVSLALLKRLKR